MVTFLRFGIRYLGNNMLVLSVTGDSLEHTLGHVKYLIFYLFSAVGTSTASPAAEVAMGQRVFNASALGTVSAVPGGLIWVFARNSGRFEEPHVHNLLFFSGIAPLSGLFAGEVDNTAHTGGLLVGFLLVAVLYRRPAVTLSNTDMI